MKNSWENIRTRDRWTRSENADQRALQEVKVARSRFYLFNVWHFLLHFIWQRLGQILDQQRAH